MTFAHRTVEEVAEQGLAFRVESGPGVWGSVPMLSPLLACGKRLLYAQEDPQQKTEESHQNPNPHGVEDRTWGTTCS